MSATVRSRLNIGIAVAGAGVIALAPINPPMPTIAAPLEQSISTAAVALSATTNPIEQWLEIISTTFTNGSALLETYLDDPAPILRQLILNGIGYGELTVTTLQTAITGIVNILSLDNPEGLAAQLKTATQQILDGDIYNGLTTWLTVPLGLVIAGGLPLIGLFDIPTKMAQNFANVVAVLPQVIGGLGFGAITTFLGTVQATTYQLQGVYDAVQAGDWLGAINEIIALPGATVDGLLNGFPLTGAPGLLSQYGLFSELIRGFNTIAQAITPDTTLMSQPFAAKVADPGPSALPSDASTVETITLDTDSGVTGVAAAAAETTPAETTVTEPVVTEPVGDPIATEPAAELVVTEPTVTEPVAVEPVETEPIVTEPVATEPAAEADTDTKPASKRAWRTPSVRTSDGDTSKTSGIRPDRSTKGESTKPSRSSRSENRSESAGSSKDSTASEKGSGVSGSDSSGAAA
ncbi:hypothetical protein [Mycobacterium sp. MS1601]|uniref:hypothetical protein n=1 Tax=Mycobacterium sp. MS1601 TaxID=1936029 RepID=UPI0012F7D026|nr:hypothetical protein [Mycobacterium sp. MS1601]